MFHKPLCYLGSPYNHSDKTIRQARYLAACRAVGKLLALGEFVYSPIAHNHPIAGLVNLPDDLEFWLQFDFTILRNCERLYILEIDGWKNSAGLRREIEFAIDNRIEMRHLHGNWGT